MGQMATGVLLRTKHRMAQKYRIYPTVSGLGAKTLRPNEADANPRRPAKAPSIWKPGKTT